jgi:hypothetical protein
MDRVSAQESVEHKFSRHNIEGTILKTIREYEPFVGMINEGVDLVLQWADTDHGYASKNRRASEVYDMNPKKIVEQVFILTLQIQEAHLFTNVVGQLAGIFPHETKIAKAKTAADILALLCDLDFYDIWKDGKYESLKIQCNYDMPEHLARFIKQTKYLPPMLVEPRKLKCNSDSGYLTIDHDSVILGSGNHHNDDVCLDALNLFNSVPLALDVELLKTYSEMKPEKIDDPDKERQWKSMVIDSYAVYRDLVKQGNEFYLTHKVDKRGRVYCCGHHISTQGNSFRKAIINLANKELVDGVPTKR